MPPGRCRLPQFVGAIIDVLRPGQPDPTRQDHHGRSKEIPVPERREPAAPVDDWQKIHHPTHPVRPSDRYGMIEMGNRLDNLVQRHELSLVIRPAVMPPSMTSSDPVT